MARSQSYAQPTTKPIQRFHEHNVYEILMEILRDIAVFSAFLRFIPKIINFRCLPALWQGVRTVRNFNNRLYLDKTIVLLIR